MSGQNASNLASYAISFPNESGNSAGAAAAALADAIRNVDESVVLNRQKANPDTQDAGSILTIVLQSAPAAAVAAGIAAWIRMRRLDIRITTKDRTVDVSGYSSDAARTIESIFKSR